MTEQKEDIRMNQYLTPEQRAQFEQQLAGDALTEQQKRQALRPSRAS